MVAKHINTIFVMVLLIIAALRVIYFQPIQLAENTSVKISGKIIQTPRIINSNQEILLKIIEPPNQKTPATLIIRTRRYPTYEVGDVLLVEGKINKYGDLSYPKIQKLRHELDPLSKALTVIRQSFQKSLSSALPEPHVSLVLGMLLGVENELPAATEDDLKRTGTIHMIVVSGFNITLVSAFVLKLAGLVHRRYAIMLAILATWLFVLLAGAQPPALRAGVMATCALIGQIFGRTTSALYLLALSALLLLIISPELLNSLSFQLSCAATAGIILLPPRFDQIFIKLSFFLRKRFTLPVLTSPLLNKFKTYLKDEGTTTISAQIAVTPLLLNSFGSLSLIAPLSNILVAWTIPYIMLSGLCVGLAGLVSQLIARIFSLVLVVFTAYFLQIIDWAAGVPYGYFEDIKINHFLISGIYIVLVYIIIKMSENK